MGGGGSTSTSGSPSQAAPANQVYSRGQSGGSHLQPQQQQRQQQHGSNSLDLSQYIAATAAMGPGGDMRSSSLESTMELTRVRSLLTWQLTSPLTDLVSGVW